MTTPPTATDPTYEVDAPKFYDFKNRTNDSDFSDSWFEHREAEMVQESPLFQSAGDNLIPSEYVSNTSDKENTAEQNDSQMRDKSTKSVATGGGNAVLSLAQEMAVAEAKSQLQNQVAAHVEVIEEYKVPITEPVSPSGVVIQPQQVQPEATDSVLSVFQLPPPPIPPLEHQMINSAAESPQPENISNVESHEQQTPADNLQQYVTQVVVPIETKVEADDIDYDKEKNDNEQPLITTAILKKEVEEVSAVDCSPATAASSFEMVKKKAAPEPDRRGRDAHRKHTVNSEVATKHAAPPSSAELKRRLEENQKRAAHGSGVPTSARPQMGLAKAVATGPVRPVMAVKPSPQKTRPPLPPAAASSIRSRLLPSKPAVSSGSCAVAATIGEQSTPAAGAKSFQFATDVRIKRRSASLTRPNSKPTEEDSKPCIPVDFTKLLRSSTPVAQTKSGPLKATVPVPFRFHELHHRSASRNNDTAAAANQSTMSSRGDHLPRRPRSSSIDRLAKPKTIKVKHAPQVPCAPPRGRSPAPRYTVPKPFKFQQTAARSNSINPADADKPPSVGTKGTRDRSSSSDVRSLANQGVPRPRIAGVTVPKPFSFSTDRTLAEHKMKREQQANKENK